MVRLTAKFRFLHLIRNKVDLHRNNKVSKEIKFIYIVQKRLKKKFIKGSLSECVFSSFINSIFIF